MSPVIDSTRVRLYGTRFCPYCVAARRLLKGLEIPFDDIPLDGEPQLRREVMAASGGHTVPQIWVGNHYVGGYTELAALHQSSGLLPLVAGLSAENG